MSTQQQPEQPEQLGFDAAEEEYQRRVSVCKGDVLNTFLRACYDARAQRTYTTVEVELVRDETDDRYYPIIGRYLSNVKRTHSCEGILSQANFHEIAHMMRDEGYAAVVKQQSPAYMSIFVDLTKKAPHT